MWPPDMGGLTLPEQPPRGGLSRRQEHLAKEMIMAGLRGGVSLAELAEACGFVAVAIQ